VESGLFNSLEETELMDDIDENANVANYPSLLDLVIPNVLREE